MRTLLVSYTKKDFRVDTFAAGGPGGQHQNKTQSGVRITHIPSGLSAECRETRSQSKNKRTAFRRLAEKIKLWLLMKIEKEHTISNEIIRTYNEPDNRVKDHISEFCSSYSEVVYDAFIDDMIESRRKKLKQST